MILVGDFIPKNLSVLLPDKFRQQIVLANLEGPICPDGLPASGKVGICLHTTYSKEILDTIGNFAFSLANNHQMDYREEGLRQTILALKERHMPFAGAGESEADARKPMILTENGKRIAIFACCERQFGMATENTAGCAAMGIWLYDAIRDIKVSKAADYVIVSCHAASEFSPWISPSLHDFYHSLIDVGADCIHGHHAHVPQGFEEYKGKPIFYGLGNFVVDPSSWSGNPNYLWSLVVCLYFHDNGIKWHAVPFLLSSNSKEIVVSEASEKEVDKRDTYIANANSQFASRRNLLACWQEASCRLYYRIYARNFRPPAVAKVRIPLRDRLRLVYFAFDELWRALLGQERPTRKSLFYGKVFYNLFNCQSHVDMIRTAMGVHVGETSDMRTEDTGRMADALGLLR